MAAVARARKPVIDRELCQQCNMCRLLCPDLAITQDSQTKEIAIDLAFCKGCGICAFVCPKEAITMVLEE